MVVIAMGSLRRVAMPAINKMEVTVNHIESKHRASPVAALADICKSLKINEKLLTIRVLRGLLAARD
jgi:hypothetical protein